MFSFYFPLLAATVSRFDSTVLKFHVLLKVPIRTILISRCKKWCNDQIINIETHLKTNYITCIHYRFNLGGKMTNRISIKILYTKYVKYLQMRNFLDTIQPHQAVRYQMQQLIGMKILCTYDKMSTLN